MNQKQSKKSLLSVLTISVLIVSCLFSFISVNADDTTEEPALEGLSIHYMDGSLDVKYQSMRPYIIIYNNSGMDVNMADLRVRYYYEKEGTTEEVLTSFYTAIGPNNIFGEFHPELGYAEIGFTDGAGAIKDGGNSGQMQLVLKKISNGYYDQSNDYSYDPSFTDYAEYDKMTLYYKGKLVWGKEGPPPPPEPTPPPNDDDWLHVEGNLIKDSKGNTVYLTGINWFGFETDGANGFYGLNKCNLEDSLDLMAKLGFNIIRIPISAEIILQWKNGERVETSFVNTYENPRLDGLSSLEILDYTINHMKKNGLKVMLDMHGASKDSYQDNLWYNKDVTMEDFIEAWKWITERYKDDDTVIAMDLKNEPHGKFSGPNIAKWDGSDDPNNWKRAAEIIAEEILAINPNLLIVVEGVEAYPMEGYDYTNCGEFTTYCNWWGGNLRGVADHPVVISAPDKLVYSVHDYGPDIYMQPWFKKDFDINTLYEECWYPNWYYIVEQNIAPMFIGEWGGKLIKDNNRKWLECLGTFIAEKKLHHTFWAFNPNSADTGGLMLEDWKTVDEEKYAIIEPTLWKKGLDHAIPLGGVTEETFKYGDLDGSFSVNSSDLTLLKRYVLKQITEFPSPHGLEAADLDGDEKITSSDVTLLKRYILRAITAFPVEEKLDE
ncbi:cellulase family glycosylhydrolase [Acetivibrio straminisolvens]|jgi:aryl-phospho-beta-D-glucosidase BglC (GH1 family)|nr:cellulase family glycosylhydrolase [Acetivibrio straminisolvens]